MQEETGKELVSTPDGAVVKRQSKPSLVLIGSRYISSDGRWHSSLIWTYLSDHGRHKWVPVGEAARVATGANTISGKKRVRRNTASLFDEGLKHNEFTLLDRDEKGRTYRMKVLDPSSEMECRMANEQLERMKRRREISNYKYEKASLIVEVTKQASAAQ